MSIWLIRHAKAGDRAHWSSNDFQRPLDAKGQRQAGAIAAALATRPLGRIVSSPALRCTQTVGPLAAHHQLEIEVDVALAEGHEPRSALAIIEACVGVNVEAAFSSHGDLIAALLEILAARGIDLGADRRCQKASMWQLDVVDGELATARYWPAP